jgi:hypothetical protein
MLMLSHYGDVLVDIKRRSTGQLILIVGLGGK